MDEAGTDDREASKAKSKEVGGASLSPIGSSGG